MSNNIAVFTANFGEKDAFEDIKIESGVDYYYFTDKLYPSKSWTIVLLPKPKSPRLLAREIKTSPEKYFGTQYKYTIWVDARLKLTQPITRFISVLDRHDILAVIHPVRNCIYQEAKVCAEYQLDDPVKIEERVRFLKDTGYPQNNGLHETGVLCRKHSPKVHRFDIDWNDMIINGSIRDQLSFDYLLWKHQMVITDIPEAWFVRGNHICSN